MCNVAHDVSMCVWGGGANFEVTPMIRTFKYRISIQFAERIVSYLIVLVCLLQ